MKPSIKISFSEKPVASFLASLIIHIIIFITAGVFVKFSVASSALAGKYVQVETRNFVNEKNLQTEEKIESEELEISEQEFDQEKVIPEEEAGYMVFSETNMDTSGLQQIYSESTLDVRIKYPAGWTYIDQNVKKKLDGVTFWSLSSNFSPPPYVHLEVKEKYLFNPARYKYSMETDNYTAYYNDPEELSGQVSQEVYIRTDTDEDFSIKLIMEGEESFKIFQPVFFGMIKTFKFDNSFF